MAHGTVMIEQVVDMVRQRGSDSTTAVIDGETSISYAALDERSNRVAQVLRALGLAEGDRVGFLGRNCAEFFELLFGAAKTGVVMCAVNWRLSVDEVRYVLEDCGATSVFVHDEFRALVPAGIRSIPLDGPEAAFGSLRDAAPTVDPGHRPQPSDTWLQLYSSGTTGHPKGVLISYGNLAAFLRAGLDINGFTADSVSMVALPVFHIGGTGWAMQALANGLPIVVMRELVPAHVLRLVEQHRVTHTLWVPTMVQMMLECSEPADISSIRFIMYGASPITDTLLVSAMERFGKVFVGSYGLTETCAGCVFLRIHDHDPVGPRRHLLRSVGQPARDTEIRVVDPGTLADLPDGTDGEILIRGPQVMTGYWRRPDATAAAIVDGWLRTGDIGNLRDGYLYVNDRLKDMIISGGENIYPAEVENVLASFPGVQEIAIVGIPHDKWGEVPVAFVVRRPTAPMTEQELISFAREHLAHFKCPTKVVFVSALPRNASGKLLKRELRRPYWEGLDRRV